MSFLSDSYHMFLRGNAGIADAFLGTNFVGDYDSKKNYDLQKANLEWQKYVQNQTWHREDTAVQRRADDLRAAGMNPIMAATGSAANSGAVVNTVSPQRATAKYDTLSRLADYLALQQSRQNIAKTAAETAVAGATEKNLEAQNQNIQVQNDLIKAQTIKTIADATGWSTEEVALKIFGFGYSRNTKTPKKDVKELHFSEDPARDEYYHNYLDQWK